MAAVGDPTHSSVSRRIPHTGLVDISKPVLQILVFLFETFLATHVQSFAAQLMDQISVTAASGMRSRMEALDLLSNNLANSSTNGFKLDREFYSLFKAEDDAFRDPALQAITLPVIQKRWTDFQQGNLQPSANPLDVALSGKGFIAVDGPKGPLYTRNGSLKLSPQGILTTQDGFPVRNVKPPANRPIQSVSQSPIEITKTGSVRQDGNEIGQMEIVNFADLTALDKSGNNYFRVIDPRAKAVAIPETAVEQGRTENSNVAAAESAVRLVELMRQYEMLNKAVSVASDLNKKATDEVAKVNG